MTRVLQTHLLWCFLSLGLLVGLVKPATSQQRVVESSLSTAPIPPAAEAEYAPCSSNLSAPAAWCMDLRIRQLDFLEQGRFEFENGECRLYFEEQTSPTRFVCGELLVSLRPRIDWTELRAIREAADGEWLRISGDGWWMLTARLRVEPGTERSALRKIMLHPKIVFAELNAIGDVVDGPGR